MLQFLYWQALDCPRSCSQTPTAIPSSPQSRVLLSSSLSYRRLELAADVGSCGRSQIHSLENSQDPQWQHSPGFGLISALGDAKEVRASSRCSECTKSGKRCSYSPLNDEIIQFLAPQTLLCQTSSYSHSWDAQVLQVLGITQISPEKHPQHWERNPD